MAESRQALQAAYAAADAVMMNNLEAYCLQAVKIKDKGSGALIPFAWNKAQRIVHERLQDQLARTGMVRALILKYRQGGISTYTAARFYHRTSLRLGKKTYILTHEDKATQNLFKMAKTIHENMVPDYRPKDTAKNANELVFGDLDSGYAVGTAKNIHGGGRSSTIHRFHGSEMAWWAHAEQHLSGVMQAIPRAPDTEVILETTANGPQGEFYRMWLQAEKGESDYIAIFLPWMIQDEYRIPDPPPFDPTVEELDYQAMHGLDNAQLAWMHYKNIELGGDPGTIGFLFKQEYPATAQEAFQTSGEDSFIHPKYVLSARKRTITDDEVAHSSVILGMDCARGGKDRSRIIDRQGRRAGALWNETYHIDDLMVLADEGIKALRETKAVLLCIDIGGLGAGVYDRIKQVLGRDDQRIVAVNFGEAATDPEKFLNKRAEMIFRVKEWLRDVAGVSIPDDDEIHRHICAPIMGPTATRWDSSQRLQIESKDKIRERLGFSPDALDALGLTFAQEIYDIPTDKVPSWMRNVSRGPMGSWKTR